MERMQQFGHDVWTLVKGYWGSEERCTRVTPVARVPHDGVVVAVRCVVASLGCRERDGREHTYA